ncbi:MAG: hypothetical protein JWS10_2054 [Cypionkella sp.]|nr:hypothetical protein [Cypionkella sp.]
MVIPGEKAVRGDTSRVESVLALPQCQIFGQGFSKWWVLRTFESQKSRNDGVRHLWFCDLSACGIGRLVRCSVRTLAALSWA